MRNKSRPKMKYQNDAWVRVKTEAGGPEELGDLLSDSDLGQVDEEQEDDSSLIQTSVVRWDSNIVKLECRQSQCQPQEILMCVESENEELEYEDDYLNGEDRSESNVLFENYANEKHDWEYMSLPVCKKNKKQNFELLDRSNDPTGGIKRKRGRPRNIDSQEKNSAIKRSRGRPRKKDCIREQGEGLEGKNLYTPAQELTKEDCLKKDNHQRNAQQTIEESREVRNPSSHSQVQVKHVQKITRKRRRILQNITGELRNEGNGSRIHENESHSETRRVRDNESTCNSKTRRGRSRKVNENRLLENTGTTGGLRNIRGRLSRKQPRGKKPKRVVSTLRKKREELKEKNQASKLGQTQPRRSSTRDNRKQDLPQKKLGEFSIRSHRKYQKKTGDLAGECTDTTEANLDQIQASLESAPSSASVMIPLPRENGTAAQQDLLENILSCSRIKIEKLEKIIVNQGEQIKMLHKLTDLLSHNHASTSSHTVQTPTLSCPRPQDLHPQTDILQNHQPQDHRPQKWNPRPQTHKAQEPDNHFFPEPIHSTSQLEKLCGRISKDAAYKEELISWMWWVGGHNLGDTIRTILRKLGNNLLWSAYSLRGKKKKLAFYKCSICRTIIYFCRKKYPFMSEKEIELTIAEALKHAPSQKGGVHYRHKELKPPAQENPSSKTPAVTSVVPTTSAHPKTSISTADPTTNTADPTTNTVDPTTTAADPTASTADPTTSTADPTTTTADPTTTDPSTLTADVIYFTASADPTTTTSNPRTSDPSTATADPPKSTASVLPSAPPSDQNVTTDLREISVRKKVCSRVPMVVLAPLSLPPGLKCSPALRGSIGQRSGPARPRRTRSGKTPRGSSQPSTRNRV